MIKIAICDDEQSIREYLKKLAEKCTDAEVSECADGEELLSDHTAKKNCFAHKKYEEKNLYFPISAKWLKNIMPQ